jgi:hypothetical protein
MAFGLHDHTGPWLAVLAGHGDDHHVTAAHRIEFRYGFDPDERVLFAAGVQLCVRKPTENLDAGISVALRAVEGVRQLPRLSPTRAG